jgi:hypothetical protein
MPSNNHCSRIWTSDATVQRRWTGAPFTKRMILLWSCLPLTRTPLYVVTCNDAHLAVASPADRSRATALTVDGGAAHFRPRRVGMLTTVSGHSAGVLSGG